MSIKYCIVSYLCVLCSLISESPISERAKSGVMEAWVTLATNDNYAVGALTLAQSLKRVETSKKVVIMITQEVTENMKKVLEEVFDKVFVVDPLDSGDLANLTLLDRTELGITFTKVKRIDQRKYKNSKMFYSFTVGPCSTTPSACSLTLTR